MAVEKVLTEGGYHIKQVDLGEAEIAEEPTKDQLDKLNTELHKLGFELIDDRKSRLIEKIRNIIVELVHHSDEPLQVNLSDYLTQQLPYDYKYLSNIFSESTGTTIEKYYISQKIEKIKELLTYDELSLSEIAYRMGYSSAAYLSNQFKKLTGLTPGHFKEIGSDKRRNIEEL
ncbi:helix-turn-helix domain-containing protein [Mucilaginibacter sp. KACC 22063]|uniref:helix-turn-helix domain-containing protein n=1 Tax=Mucilaginibacter sp. KACC 22063 TaxID=3025666 RepID=UPI0023668400|nr:AraC family transcriptional regulator [Mucilaginibacter sp. KACC 22063]WDF54056.1 AraC family transcriptional regulator [Mucilaginibacter sp. KACC 22063]